MRATAIQQVQRTNLAVSLLNRHTPSTTVLGQLMARYQLSRRQAYRYLTQAATHREPRPVPALTTVFTVKLPTSLVQQIRQRAKVQQCWISHWVTQALQEHLQRARTDG